MAAAFTGTCAWSRQRRLFHTRSIGPPAQRGPPLSSTLSRCGFRGGTAEPSGRCASIHGRSPWRPRRMGGISRAGNERLRALLVSGATSVIQAAVRPGGRQMTEWLRACCSASHANSPPWTRCAHRLGDYDDWRELPVLAHRRRGSGMTAVSSRNVWEWNQAPSIAR